MPSAPKTNLHPMDTDFNNGVRDCAWSTSCGAPAREIIAEELEQGVYGGSTQQDPHLACLRLGKRHYYGVGKRSGKGGGMARCQVEGCNAVLVSAKEYHKRHKVCEVHAKAPKVVVLGLHQRFCQQCSRFHPVSEFDEWKRSCRRRLAGHNQRRRKTSASYSHLPFLINSSTLQDEKKVGEKGGHSLLSAAADDLSWRSSAALQELIAENRASLILLAGRHRCHWDTRTFHQGSGHVTLDLMHVPSSALCEARGQGQYFDQPQVLQIYNLLQATNTNNHINHLF